MRRELKIRLSRSEVAKIKAKAKKLESDRGWLHLQESYSITRAVRERARDVESSSKVSVRRLETMPNGSIIAHVVIG